MFAATLYDQTKYEQIRDAAAQIEFLVSRIDAVAQAAIEHDAKKRADAGDDDCQTYWLLDTIIGVSEQIKDLSCHIRGY